MPEIAAVSYAPRPVAGGGRPPGRRHPSAAGGAGKRPRVGPWHAQRHHPLVPQHSMRASTCAYIYQKLRDGMQCPSHCRSQRATDAVTWTIAVPTLPSPPPKNRRNLSFPDAIGVAEHRKMTFLRSPLYLQSVAPLQSVSYSNLGIIHWPLSRWMILLGSSLSRMMYPAV